jgi:hypothetical protein
MASNMRAMKRRAYQSEALRADKMKRLFALLFERQAGKSTTLAEIALKRMMKQRDYTCIYASASLLLGREIILKESQQLDVSARQLIQRDAAVLQDALQRATTEESAFQVQTANAETGKVVKELTADDFAELFEAQRLEFRVYHDRTSYSRTQVIAPNVATARGWSGSVFLDEIAFIRNFMELWIAIEPIISTDPSFRLILATTPPQDDTHASFELLAAPAGMTFPPNPAGNWYESEAGIPVLRADAFDTFAAGKKIFDVKTGEEITPVQSFQRAINKDGWRINHGLEWLIGGTSACNLLYLKAAQERGVNGPNGDCRCFVIDSDEEFAAALTWLAKHVHPTNPVALGLDVATTTKESSNPSVVAVVEAAGADTVVRCFVIWKTRDPDVARERIDRLLTIIEHRTYGRAKAMAVDATNEKYFAEDVRKQFRARVPVLLVVASERVEKPGLEKPTNYKEYLGGDYVGVLDDNKLTLPPEIYVRTDHRLVRKDRGKFVCEPSPEGMHGDTFDAGKLGLYGLRGKFDEPLRSLDGISFGGTLEGRPIFIPHPWT